MYSSLQRLIKIGFIIIISYLDSAKCGSSGQKQASLMFITGMKSHLGFFNTETAWLDCLVHGSPDPDINWFTYSSKLHQRKVTDITSVRRVFKNGTLMFMEFTPEQYIQEVHATTYRCSASNIHGMIISPPVSVRAVIKPQQQRIQAQVYDEYVIKDNTAVLRCHIPTFFKDDLKVTAWIREDNYIIEQHQTDNEYYTVTNTGNLHIRHAGASPSTIKFGYWCQVKNMLTGDTFLSQSSGKVILTKPQSPVPPTITDIPEKVYVEKGKTTELSCAAQGYPPPSYKWKTPDGRTAPNTDGLISIKEVESPGSFEYRCTATSNHGEDSKSISLIVKETIGVYMTQRDLNDGVELECHITGYPVDKIEWMFNGKYLHFSKRISKKSKENKELILIKNAGSDDLGMYQCFASNKWETKQAAIQLELGDYAPSFLQTFQSKTLQPGPSIQLECSGIGQPTPTIQWKRNGKFLYDNDDVRIIERYDPSGSISSKIIIKDIQTKDGGEYYCVLRNSVGNQTHSNRINIYGLPFVHDMGNISISEGEDVRINCYVSGYPLKDIKWSRGDHSYLPHTSKTFPNGTLTLYDVENEETEGQYICTAGNGQGQWSDKNLWVTIIRKPTLLPLHVPHGQIVEGNPLSIMCSIISGDNPITITWTRNEEDVPLGNSVDITTTKTYSVLQIHELRSMHSANYTCKAENRAGITIQTVEVRVSVSPSWQRKPKDLNVNQGAMAKFECSANGYPKPTTEWFRVQGSHYQRISKSNKVDVSSDDGSLIIHRSSVQDAGQYRCVISNGVKKNLVKEVHLNVGDTPIISRLYKQYENDSALSLSCEVKSQNPVQISWNRNEIKVINDSDTRIYVAKSKRFTSRLLMFKSSARTTSRSRDVFICIASNEFGESKRQLKLQAFSETVIQSTRPVTAITKSRKSKNTTKHHEEEGTTASFIIMATKSIDVKRKQQDVYISKQENNQVFGKESSITENERAVKDMSNTQETKHSTARNILENMDPTILFIVPAAAVIILLMAIIGTVVIYMIRRRKNIHRNQQLERRTTSSNVGERSENKMLMTKLSNQNKSSLDRRYGCLNHQRTSFPGVRTSCGSAYSNNYEIPDYCAGMKPYATLQLSSRINQFGQNLNQQRDSQASL
ncbi:Uncharacterised protein g3435 [Pycnogonum litorale]